MEAHRAFLCALPVLVALLSERFVVLAAFSQSLDSDFTFTLPPGQKECFYQTMRKDASLEIEYQVLNTHIPQETVDISRVNWKLSLCGCILQNQ